MLQNPAAQEALELAQHERRYGPLGGGGLLDEAWQLRIDDAVERRLGWPAWPVGRR